MDADDPLAVWWGLVRAHTALVDALEAALAAELDLPLSSYEVLAVLGHVADQRLPMHELAALLPITRSGLTRLVDRMEQGELVERMACATDRRVTHVGLTRPGQDMLRRAEPIHERVLEERLTTRLTRADLARFRDACDRLASTAG